MSATLDLDLDFSVPAGICVQVSPLVRRVVADNPGPITFTGTCSYIVGSSEVAIIDPGPDSPSHVAALLDATRGETITHILVSHTHKDHSPAARALQSATGAPILGCSAHRFARPLGPGELNPLEASGDVEHRPDRELREGDAVEGGNWRLETIETPGHMANHLCFALPDERALFSADHVMAWATTVVGPPDGAMSAYMASLDKLRDRDETIYWPGHGGPVTEPRRFVRALAHHRRQREASILNRLSAGDRTVGAMVSAIYQGLAPGLQGAAGLSVFAHLEDLVGRGVVATDGAPTLASHYRLA
jgi:glyoxylase-like metal-dependent hydrolase (beta-lactamase superfamily II)